MNLYSQNFLQQNNAAYLSYSKSSRYNEPEIKPFNISETYITTIERLKSFSSDNLDVYFGGPIKRESGNIQWVQPVNLYENSGGIRSIKASYQLSYINFNPNVQPEVTPKLIPFISCENGIKLGSCSCNCSKRFEDLLDKYSGMPYMILRRSFLSNPSFPNIINVVNPAVETELKFILEVIEEIKALGFDLEIDNSYLNIDLPCTFDSREVFFENDELQLLGPKLIENEFGTFYSYTVSFNSDLWENYEIISGKLLEIGKTEELIVRFDSGCDTGQIYNDSSCDCRDQLRSALKEIKREGRGIVIHIPSHDGRGYGMAGKMETELYKSGISGVINKVEKPLDTVSAAKLLYGDIYDIRTYFGAAKILKALGLKTVKIYTDNSEKFKAIKASGINVVRLKTDTHKASAQEHIDAKHNSPPYDLKSWEES